MSKARERANKDKLISVCKVLVVNHDDQLFG